MVPTTSAATRNITMAAMATIFVQPLFETAGEAVCGAASALGAATTVGCDSIGGDVGTVVETGLTGAPH
jgi:hypothetical protein